MIFTTCNKAVLNRIELYLKITMKYIRCHGSTPYRLVVIHGGPGALGEMASVARELSSVGGVIEPLLTSKSIKGQLSTLQIMLKKYATLPSILIGFSWGAWLSFLFTAAHPSFVKKLIMISSGPFVNEYASNIMETRIRRLTIEEQNEIKSLQYILDDPAHDKKDAAFARLGMLLSKADAFDPISSAFSNSTACARFDVFTSVWLEAEALRTSGKLLEAGTMISCPVIAIHGEDDPHPAAGVEKPLAAILDDFRFLLLRRCGHRPWIERHAREQFYRVLKGELTKLHD